MKQDELTDGLAGGTGLMAIIEYLSVRCPASLHPINGLGGVRIPALDLPSSHSQEVFCRRKGSKRG